MAINWAAVNSGSAGKSQPVGTGSRYKPSTIDWASVAAQAPHQPTMMENHLINSFKSLDPTTRQAALDHLKATKQYDTHSLLTAHATDDYTVPAKDVPQYSKLEKVSKAATGAIMKYNVKPTLAVDNYLIKGGIDALTASGGQGSGDVANRLKPTAKNPSGRVINVNGGHSNSPSEVIGQAAENAGFGAGIKGAKVGVKAVKSAVEDTARATAGGRIRLMKDVVEANPDAPLQLPAGKPMVKPGSLPSKTSVAYPSRKIPGGGVIVNPNSTEAKVIANAGKPTKIQTIPGRPGSNVTDITAPRVTKAQVAEAGQRIVDGAPTPEDPAPKTDLNVLMGKWSKLRNGDNAGNATPGKAAHIQTLNDIIEHPEASPKVKEQAVYERNEILRQSAKDKLAQTHATETGQHIDAAHQTLQEGYGPHGPLYQALHKPAPRVAHDLSDEFMQAEAPKEEVPALDPNSPAAKGESHLLDGRSGGVQKAVRSGEGIIRSMGDNGKQLVDLMDKQGADENAFSNKYHNMMPTLLKLNKEEATNLFNHIEEGEAPLNDKVVKAAEEWGQVRKQVLEDARANGREVADRGDTYMPHNYGDLFKSNASRQAAAEAMVKNGEAKDLQEAQSQLRMMERAHNNGKKFGNFDKERTGNSSLYKRDVETLTGYVDGAARAISHDLNYGTRYEKANDLLSKMGAERHDADYAKQVFDYHTGEVRATDNGMWKGIRAFEAATKLGRASISNITQINNTQTMTGVIHTSKAAADAVVAMLKHGPTKDYLDETGVIGSHAVEQIRSVQGGVKGKLASIIMPLFNTIETFNRATAALAGRSFAQKLATKGDPASLKFLTDVLRIKGDINGGLTHEQEIQASRALVKHTQFLVGSKDLPAWATQTGAGRTAAQFRSFSYKQQQFIFDQVLKPAAHGNVSPLARYVIGTALLGAGAYKTRTMFNKTDTSKNSNLTNDLNIVQAAGGFGIAGDSIQNFLESSSYDHPGSGEKTLIALAALAGGPAASDAASFGVDVKKATDGSTYGPFTLEKNTVSRTPVVGPRLSKTIFDKKQVAVGDGTFKSMRESDKIDYVLKTNPKNLNKLSQKEKDSAIKSLLTDKKTIEGLTNPDAKSLKAGSRKVSLDEIKTALKNLGVPEDQYGARLEMIKKTNSETAKASKLKAKQDGKYTNPITGK